MIIIINMDDDKEKEEKELNDLIDNLPVSNSLPKYIPIEKLITLRRRGLSYNDIGKICGCSSVNALMRLKGKLEDIDSLEDFKKTKADILHLKQKKLLQSLTSDSINDMSGKDKAISFAILFDKTQLLEGKPTAGLQVDYINQSIIDLESRIAAAIDITPSANTPDKD